MKRLPVLLVLLALVGGVILLYGLVSDEGVARGPRRADAAPGASGAGGGTGADPGTTSEKGPAGKPGGTAATVAGALDLVDEDTNRIPGPPVNAGGIVLRDGKPVAGATVAIHRSYPKDRTYNWWSAQQRKEDRARPPIARMVTKADGRFALTFPRRTRFTLDVYAKGSAQVRTLVLVPDTGDPDELRIHLRPGKTLNGLVRDVQGVPIANATVLASIPAANWYTPAGWRETTSAADGSFALDDMPNGSVSVRVTAEGYAESRQSVRFPTYPQVLVVLHKGGTLFGRLTDADGNALSGAFVIVRTDPGAGQGAGEAETDAEGRYRIEGLAPGPLTSVLVRAEGYPRRTAGDEFPYPQALVQTGEALEYDIQLGAGVTVTGVVVKSTDNQPLAGVEVKLARQTNRQLIDLAQTTTGADGRFRFERVPPGSYGLAASADGWARPLVRWPQGNKPLTLDVFVQEGGLEPEPARIEVEPSGRVMGRVIGLDLDRSRNESVNIQMGGSNLNAPVDAVGAFAFPNVPPAPSVVVKMWNPSAESEPFAVIAGETAHATIDIMAKGGFTGVVVDEDGKPVRDAAVMANPNTWMNPQQLQQLLTGNAWGAARTNAEGRFHVGVQSGARQSQASSDWAVAAGHPEYGIATVKGLKLPKEGGTLEVRVVLARGLTISGRVEWHGGGPVGAANVTLSPKPKSSGPRQSVIGLMTRSTVATRSTRSDFDGSFRFAGVPSGTYRLSATTTEGKSRSEEIEAGAMDVRLEVQKTSFIGGQVIDDEGKPVTGASVTVLIPSGKKKESKRSANTSGNGRFRIVHVEAGTYVIEVAPSKQQWWGAPQDHFVKQTLDAVTTGVDDLIIRVDRGAPIRGRVLGPSGKPMRGAGVIAIPKKIERRRGGNYWNAMHPSAVTDAQGEFKLRGVGEQAFELLVLAHGMLPETHDATAGQEGLVIRVSKGGEIRGKLLGVDGKPVSGQWLWLQVVGGEAQKRMSDLQQRAGQSWHQYGQRTGTNTDGDGKFAIVGLIPGEYRINGQVQGGVIPDVKVTSGGPPITIRLERPMTVSGLIVDAQGGPLVFSTENARVWVNARIGNRWLQGTQAHSDGTFEIKNLPAGTLTLQIWGGTDYKAKTVEVEAGTSGLEIALEKNVPKPR